MTTGVLGTLLVAGSIWFFTIDSGFGFRGPRVDGDGIYFWLYLRSLVMDRDVDFTNDYARYGNPWNYAKTDEGKPMNPATVGSALLWAPFYLPARGLVAWAASSGVAVRSDGTSHAEELAAFYGSFIYGFLAILLVLRLCRRHYPRGPALLGTVAAAVGGNLVFYMVVQPCYSHAPAAFALAAFVERWDATREGRRVRDWVLLGALGGLAMLVRPQLAVAAVLPLVDLVVEGVAAARRRSRARAQWLALGAGAGLAAAVLVFTPQMLCWKAIHGKLLAIPQGESFMQWGRPLWSEVLFHPRAGLLPWMPLALPALVGLGILVWRRWRLGLPLVLLFALMTYVNGASWDWWAGYAYGARRFTALYVVLALGLAVILDLLWRLVRARARAVAVGAVVTVVVGFCLLNISMIRNRRHQQVDWYSNHEFQKVYVKAVGSLAEQTHEAVGNPLSWPANLVFAARYGVSPGSYDEVAGRYFLDEKHGITHHGWRKKLKDELNLTTRWTRPFLASGFGHVQRQEGRLAVLVLEPTACILLPMVQRPDIELTLSGGSIRRTRLTARFNGQDLGHRDLIEPWQQLKFKVAGKMINRGMNTLCLEHRALGPAGPAPSRQVGQSGVRSPVDIAVFSAGARRGDRASIWVDNRRVGTNQRGVNVVALDPGTGEVRDVNGFDLSYWPSGGELLLKWVEGLPRGTIVVMAVRGDGGRLFDAAARRALRKIGAMGDLKRWRQEGYAAVGVHGGGAGTALEAHSAGRPAVVTVGRKPLAWTGVAHYDRLSLKVTRQMEFE